MDCNYFEEDPNNITYDIDNPFENENSSITKNYEKEVQNYEQEIKELRLALDNQIKNIMDLEEERELLQRKNKDLQKYKVEYHILLENNESAGNSNYTKRNSMVDQEIQTDDDENDLFGESCTTRYEKRNSTNVPVAVQQAESNRNSMLEKSKDDSMSYDYSETNIFSQLQNNTGYNNESHTKELTDPFMHINQSNDHQRGSFKKSASREKNQSKQNENAEKIWIAKCEKISKEQLDINKDNTKLRKENKILAQAIKKMDKEHQEMILKFRQRDEIIQKLRDENNDISLMVNNERSISIKQLQSEVEKTRIGLKKLTSENEILVEENSELKKRLTDLISNAELMKQKLMEFNSEIKMNKEIKNDFKKMISELNDKQKQIEQQTKLTERSSSGVDKYKEMYEKEIMEKEDMRNLADRKKAQLERALEDLDFYRKILQKQDNKNR